MKSNTSYVFAGLVSALALAGCGSSGPPTESPAPTVEKPHDHSSDDGHHSEPAATVPTPEPTPEPAAVIVDLMAVEMAAYESAKPVFEEQCAGCHTPEAKRKKPKKGVTHFSMAGYPFEGHHSAELGQSIRVSIGATDKAATMPQDDPGSLEGADLAALVAWADAFDAAAKAGVGYHAAAAAGHEHKDKAKHEHKKHKPKHKHKKKKSKEKEHKHGHGHGHGHKH